MAETQRRLNETKKLAETLAQQRTDFTERLCDIEAQQEEGDIGPDLRQKLIDVEREYDEVGRESARVFLAPKSGAVGSDDEDHSTFVLDGRVGMIFLLHSNRLTIDTESHQPG